MNTSPSALTFFRTSARTALGYGFAPVEMLKQHEQRTAGAKVRYTASAQQRRTDALSGILTGGMCRYFDAYLHTNEQPTLFFSLERVPRTAEPALGLHIFNVEKSIAEALLIQVVLSVLSDLGFTNHTVRINALGDKESAARYLRDLTHFFRKRIDTLPEGAREQLKKHALLALMHLIEHDDELSYKTPRSLEYLSDQSRKHFREIVEYLDTSRTPYEIDPRLVGHHECYSDTLFSVEVAAEGEPPIRAQGGRYSAFIEHTSSRAVPAIGAVVTLLRRKAPAEPPRAPRAPAPAVSVVHIGFAPKIRSLMLIDELRRAGIAIQQNIVYDSLCTQLAHAEAGNVQYVVILGQKELVENTVIVRDMQARNQTHLPIAELTPYLRRTIAGTTQ